MDGENQVPEEEKEAPEATEGQVGAAQPQDDAPEAEKDAEAKPEGEEGGKVETEAEGQPA